LYKSCTPEASEVIVFWISILYPSEESRYITLAGKKVVVGRTQSCDLVLGTDGVSRRHCILQWLPSSKFKITDLGSTNGIFFIDGNSRVAESAELFSGEKIWVGQCIVKVETRFEEPHQNTREDDRLRAQAPETTAQELESLASASPVVRRLLASRTDAPSSLLKSLSESYDAKILQNLASNPNTPPEVLMMLGEYFPELLRSNPVYPLLLLEDAQLQAR
jgi:hypothetical protein